MLILFHKMNLEVFIHFLQFFLTLRLSGHVMIWWKSPVIASGPGTFCGLDNFPISSIGMNRSFLSLLGLTWINFIFLRNCSFHWDFQIYFHRVVKMFYVVSNSSVSINILYMCFLPFSLMKLVSGFSSFLSFFWYLQRTNILNY